MAENKNIVHLDDNNFQDSIAKGVILVDFYATWCGPCRMVTPVVEELSIEMNGKARVAKVDVDQAQGIATSLQITSVPTLILFKDGKEVKRVVGVKDIDYLRHIVTAQL